MSTAIAAPSPAAAQMSTAFALQPQYSGALGELKRVAFERFAARGFPKLREEDWRYINLNRFETRKFALNSSGDLNAAQPALAKFKAAAGRSYAVFIDGRFRDDLSQLPGNGITATSIADMLHAAPTVAAELLSSSLHHADVFAALNLALLQEGLVIDVSADAQIDDVLHFIFLSTSQDAVMAHPRIVLHLGSRATLSVVEHYAHAAQSESFMNTVTTIQLDDGARLEHCRVQEESPSAVHIGTLFAEVGRDAQLISHNFALGASIARLGIAMHLRASGAEATLNGLQFADGTQQLDTHTQVDHIVPHTRSTEDYRGIANGRGRVVFNGKVFVHADAVKTDAQQSSRNLLLAATAEIDTKPELEIYADDVKCAHGATVGQLDPAALFYLRSRGLDHDEARAVLTLAFADAVVARVSSTALRGHLSDAVHRRFNRENPA